MKGVQGRGQTEKERRRRREKRKIKENREMDAWQRREEKVKTVSGRGGRGNCMTQGRISGRRGEKEVRERKRKREGTGRNREEEEEEKAEEKAGRDKR